MGWEPCQKCGELRKWGIVVHAEGIDSPPCHHCGDPGFTEPLTDDDDKRPGMS